MTHQSPPHGIALLVEPAENDWMELQVLRTYIPNEIVPVDTNCYTIYYIGYCECLLPITTILQRTQTIASQNK